MTAPTEPSACPSCGSIGYCPPMACNYKPKEPSDNGLTEAQVSALQSLAHIAIGSLSHTIEKHAATALLDYMASLERHDS